METVSINDIIFDSDWATDITPVISDIPREEDDIEIIIQEDIDDIYMSEESKRVARFFEKFWEL